MAGQDKLNSRLRICLDYDYKNPDDIYTSQPTIPLAA
jgi:hypothetical protein